MLAMVLLALTTTAQAGIWPRQNGPWDRLNNGGTVRGNIKVPVIFVNFAQANQSGKGKNVYSDDEYTISEANQTAWMTKLNATAGYGGTQYFKDMSYGNVNVTFDKIGVYTASGKASNYTTTYTNLVNSAVSNFKSTNWNNYDSNGDGFVDMVLLIFAGHADGDLTSGGKSVASIYPQSGWLDISTGQGTTISGVSGLKFSRYLYIADLAYNSKNRDGLSTALHELGHALFDLPDYYNKSTGNPSYGSNMGFWDTMDYGVYVDMLGGATPVPGLSSFSRMLNGWLTPTELTTQGHYTLNPLNSEAKCYMIKDTNTHYYLLEARHGASGTWDHGLTSGLIVTEVNEANNEWILYHQSNDGKVKVIRADKTAWPSSNYTSNVATQPFGPKVKAIDASYGAVFGTKTVTNITVNSNGSVEFDFMSGATTDPTPETPTTPVAPSLTVTPSTKSLAVGATVKLAVTTNSNGAVTYTSSNTAIATVDATGTVTAKAAGTATITVSVAATDKFTAASTKCTITVTAGKKPGGGGGKKKTQATGVDEISTDAEADIIYDLQGRRVDSNYKGIVIKNGRKVLQR